MDIRSIVHVRTIAQFGNLTKASEHLHITQPSLSQSIKHIEEELGILLFTRSRKGMALTELGQKFVLESEAVIKSFENFKSNIQSFKSQEVHHIGLFKLAYTTPINDAIMNYIYEHNDDNYMIKVESIETLEDMVYKDQLDLAIIKYTPVYKRNRQLSYQVLFKEKLYAIVSQEHPLAEKDVISIKELEGNRLITSAEHEYPNQLTQHILKEAGIQLEIHTHTNYYNLKMILDLVERNMGVGFATENICKHYNHMHFKAIALYESYDYEVCLVQSKRSDLNLKNQLMISYIKDQI